MVLKKSYCILPLIKIGDKFKIIKMKRVFSYCFITLLMSKNISFENIEVMFKKCTKTEAELLFNIIKHINIDEKNNNIIGDHILNLLKMDEFFDKLINGFDGCIKYISYINQFVYNIISILKSDTTNTQIKLFDQMKQNISDVVNTSEPEIVFPGGRKTKDETSLVCAIREMVEEMGKSVDNNYSLLNIYPYVYLYDKKEDNNYYSSILFPAIINLSEEYISSIKPHEKIFEKFVIQDAEEYKHDTNLYNYICTIKENYENILITTKENQDNFIKNSELALSSEDIINDKFFLSFNNINSNKSDDVDTVNEFINKYNFYIKNKTINE